MKKWCVLVGALALSALIGLGTAFGEEAKKPRKTDKPKPTAEEVFKKLDTNNDKKLSLDEFVAPRKAPEAQEKAKEIFKAKDKDCDGFLTFEEFTARPEKKHAPKKRGDGKK